MMSNYRDNLIKALEKHFEAKITYHVMNVEVLLGSHTGVADHPDFMGTIESEIKQISSYKDKLGVLEKYFK